MERKKKEKTEVYFWWKKPFVFLQNIFFSKSGAAFYSRGVRACALKHLTLAKSPNSISNQLSHFQFLCSSFMLSAFIDTLTFHGEWALFSWQPLSPTPLSCTHFTSSQLPASWEALCHQHHLAGSAVVTPKLWHWTPWSKLGDWETSVRGYFLSYVFFKST